MNAVAEDLDLAALTGDFAPHCDVTDCAPLEAVAICWWNPRRCCEESNAANLLCEPHRDATLRAGRSGFWNCDCCGAVRRIDRIEALR